MNKRKIKRYDSESISMLDAKNLYNQMKVAKGVTKDCIDNFNTAYELFCRENEISEDSPVSVITEQTIYSWVDYMTELKHLRAESINAYLSRMRTFLYWCMDNNYLEQFKISLVSHQEESLKYYTDDDLKALLRKPDSNCSFTEYRSWVIVCFILGTGARAGTICNIKQEDVDFNAKEVAYRHLKNKKYTIVPLSNSLCNILSEYLRTWNLHDCEYLFCDVGEGMLTTSAIRQALNKYCKKRGVQALGPHALRNSFARGWIRNGGGAFQLQQMLTHSDLTMTRRYVKLFSLDLQDDVQQFNPLDSLRKGTSRTKTVARR